MSAPTPAVRKTMLTRDLGQCARCRTRERLEAQHRQAVGMGGSKTRPIITELITLCWHHNSEAEASQQTEALALGHKVKRWRTIDPARIPVHYEGFGWPLLSIDGDRHPIAPAIAASLMRASYGDDWDRWCREVDLLIPGVDLNG